MRGISPLKETSLSTQHRHRIHASRAKIDKTKSMKAVDAHSFNKSLNRAIKAFGEKGGKFKWRGGEYHTKIKT